MRAVKENNTLLPGFILKEKSCLELETNPFKDRLAHGFMDKLVNNTVHLFMYDKIV